MALRGSGRLTGGISCCIAIELGECALCLEHREKVDISILEWELLTLRSTSCNGIVTELY
jgi:hypothetical protein